MRLSLFFIAVFACCLQGNAQQNNSLVFISDTQNPLWVEKIVLKTENNKAATGTLFKDLLQQEFATLFMLGDMTGSGAESQWQETDKLVAGFEKKNIPVYATPGNHDYMFFEERGRENFITRFGYNATIGTVKVVDSLAVVLLNSNFGKLTETQLATQLQWYDSTMSALNNSTGVKAIIVGCHHSPYTNSKIEAPDKKVQGRFVPIYIATPKAVLFVSGHSHNLEYFTEQNKPFLVIGGGGGLAQGLKEEQLYADQLYDKEKLRFFYLIVTRENNKLLLETRGFSNGSNLREPTTMLLETIAL